MLIPAKLCPEKFFKTFNRRRSLVLNATIQSFSAWKGKNVIIKKV